MTQKIRPARIWVGDVEWGDVLVTRRSDGAQVIGTVIDTPKITKGQCIFTVRSRANRRIEINVKDTAHVLVHVPRGKA